uniref:ORF40n n=1 Tax=Pinus koraiensis TaxID=88728 RepID=A4QM80_PINKO|nr:ORF40n [Pinus koraiensis]ABP35418.1 ORF40n [Pinus koraiensis]
MSIESHFWYYSGRIPLISSQILNNENDFPIIEILILQSVL